MHLFQTNILSYGDFYMFQTQGFIVRKKVVYAGMVSYVLHAVYCNFCM